MIFTDVLICQLENGIKLNEDSAFTNLISSAFFLSVLVNRHRSRFQSPSLIDVRSTTYAKINAQFIFFLSNEHKTEKKTNQIDSVINN